MSETSEQPSPLPKSDAASVKVEETSQPEPLTTEIVLVQGKDVVTGVSSGDTNTPPANVDVDEKGVEVPVAVHETISMPPPSDGSGKPDSFAQLVRTWEAYINDDEGDAFQPLQLLQMQSLQLCGRAGEGLARLTGPSFPGINDLAPTELRHTHSSPLVYRPAMYDYNDEDTVPPPPVPLNPFQRSSSTPSTSTFRTNSMSSAFGTADRSAFTLPSQRSNYASEGTGDHFSAFDPVKYYATALEDMERTSIEVMDMSSDRTKGGSDAQADGKEPTKPARRGAASRAARFLSDVRTLRRRRRIRGGRENPAQPPSVSSNEDSEGQTNKAAVTVITESNYIPQEIPAEALAVQTPEVADPLKEKEEPVYSAAVESDPEDGKDTPPGVDGQYHQLDSDVDEEEIHYQKIEASLQPESPGTVPSPSYQQIGDERPLSGAAKPGRVDGKTIRIQVSSPSKPDADKTSIVPVGSTPSPTLMAQDSGSNLTPRSNDSGTGSPGTTRSSNTGSSSGHTTQAASLSSGQQSTLSTVSETDREVMEANKQGKRRLDSRIVPVAQKSDIDGTSFNSSSTGSSNPAGYLALEESPVALREGANVPAYRFFTGSPGGADGANQSGVSMRSRTTSTKKSSCSPVTLGSSSATNTSSSNSSSEEPPTFVSYLQRESASDLTSVREAAETSSPRAGGVGKEEREGSPSEIVGYPQVLFEEANGLREQQPSPVRLAKQNLLDKYRTRPPRSPVKGARPVTTPPPRGSVSPLHLQHSPPRILDHPDSGISRPYVMRTALGAGKPVARTVMLPSVLECPSLVPADGSDEFGTQEANVPKQTDAHAGPFEEGSIEVLKRDSKDALNTANVVTPEKELNV